LAVNNISSAAILAEDKVKSFSTTLLATVTFRDGADLFAASFWLGDGAIAAYGPAGKVRVLGTPDSGEYAGQTRFLDADAVSDAGFSKRISIGKWNDISHLVLMTDGVSDPWFETDNGLQNPQKWDRLMAELSPLLTDPEHASAQLVEWLNYFSPGNHDDRTIIVLW
ncbi:TPA: PP2C family serine/threonine-protein phosphatase, partial [Klebsiella pneumoniae]